MVCEGFCVVLFCFAFDFVFSKEVKKKYCMGL